MSSSFSLHPATAADIPALAEICGLSLESDRHTMLKAAHPTRPYDHAAGMVGAFEYWLSRPAGKIELTKAVDDKTRQILGFVCWGFHLDQPEPQPQAQQEPQQPSPAQEESPSSGAAEQDDETSGRAGVKKPSHLVSEDYVKTDAPDLDALARLEELTSAHLAAYQEKIMPPGTRAMYIVTIAVRPDAHGRGVGSALVRRGTDRADAEGQAQGGGDGVLCWVHSSEGGAGVFRACGFEVDDTLEIDLDEWARPLDIRPPPGEDRWGLYTFRYMVRQPRAVR